jgi:RNA polymerase sigma-70 factor (ECF subfamily)
MMDDIDDFALMARLRAGDDLALNAIMQRWKNRIGAFLYRLTGDHETALDLAQETFVRLYNSRHKYQPSAAFSTYLFHIASNLARTHARWRVRHPTVPLLDGEGALVDDRADGRPTPDTCAELRDKAVMMSRALSLLPDDLRQPLLLATLEQMSHLEIARVLGCSEKAVEVRIYRARQKLREVMSGQHRPEDA